MQTNGIIRRIDDLGRIVIPREYRRLYGIDVGDPMEITASGGEILIKKVDINRDFVKNAQKVLLNAQKRVKGTLLLYNKRQLLYFCGQKIEGEFIQETPQSVVESIEKLQGKVLSGNIFADEIGLSASVFPCHSSGDCYGAIVHLYKGEEGEIDRAVVSLCASVVAEYMQKY